ncbi:hypothetical protein [Amycolatopsis sp. NPDC051071]|uniref:hypothetical protein n=1 Tax=Amycolatopsis sp. NPDC051071 TaxID=3154637 RepID=UPI003428323F
MASTVSSVPRVLGQVTTGAAFAVFFGLTGAAVAQAKESPGADVCKASTAGCEGGGKGGGKGSTGDRPLGLAPQNKTQRIPQIIKPEGKSDLQKKGEQLKPVEPSKKQAVKPRSQDKDNGKKTGKPEQKDRDDNDDGKKDNKGNDKKPWQRDHDNDDDGKKDNKGNDKKPRQRDHDNNDDGKKDNKGNDKKPRQRDHDNNDDGNDRKSEKDYEYSEGRKSGHRDHDDDEGRESKKDQWDHTEDWKNRKAEKPRDDHDDDDHDDDDHDDDDNDDKAEKRDKKPSRVERPSNIRARSVPATSVPTTRLASLTAPADGDGGIPWGDDDDWVTPGCKQDNDGCELIVEKLARIGKPIQDAIGRLLKVESTGPDAGFKPEGPNRKGRIFSVEGYAYADQGHWSALNGLVEGDYSFGIDGKLELTITKEGPQIDLEALLGAKVTGPEMELPLGPLLVKAKPELSAGVGAKFGVGVESGEDGKRRVKVKGGLTGPFGVSPGLETDLNDDYFGQLPDGGY